jgi:hypothetical protein
MPLRYGQVFWLPDLSTHRAFPSRPGAIVAFLRVSSPVTAAGPQRFYTAFPRSPHGQPIA